MKTIHARLVIAAAGLLACAGPAAAEVVRYRYIPTDACGTMTLVASGPKGAPGEQLYGFGKFPQPYYRVFRPNQMVTFRHPFNGRNATLPLTLPQGEPRVDYLYDRIVYSYGSYVVEARFLEDGAVDIVYNSGFLRPLVVE